MNNKPLHSFYENKNKTTFKKIFYRELSGRYSNKNSISKIKFNNDESTNFPTNLSVNISPKLTPSVSCIKYTHPGKNPQHKNTHSMQLKGTVSTIVRKNEEGLENKQKYVDTKKMMKKFKVTNGAIMNKYNNLFHKDQFTKKYIKGKLINLVNKKILINVKTFSSDLLSSVNKNSPSKSNSQKFRALDDRLKVNIYTNKSTNIIGESYRYTNRFIDNLMLPDELIYKNFNAKEIEMLKSDPVYFRTNTNRFTNVEFFKNKNLIELLREEEQEKNTKQSITRNIKQSIKMSLNRLNEIFKSYEQREKAAAKGQQKNKVKMKKSSAMMTNLLKDNVRNKSLRKENLDNDAISIMKVY